MANTHQDMQELRLEYMPLSVLVQLKWDKNPKQHDIGALIQSFREYGFQKPIRFSAKLNEDGAVAAGNGRVKALMLLYREDSTKPPKGVKLLSDNDWAVPVILGNEFESKLQATKFAIDDNNMGLMGGDFNALDMARLWRRDEYLSVLQGLGSTVTVSNDDIQLLQRLATLSEEQQEDSISQNETERSGDGDKDSTLQVVKVYLTSEEKEELDNYIETYGVSAKDLLINSIRGNRE